MENILLFLLPGIIGTAIFDMIFVYQPKENEFIQLIKQYSLFTFLFFLIFIILNTILSPQIKFASHFDIMNIHEITIPMTVWQLVVSISVSTVLPPLIYGAILKIGKLDYGSQVFTKYFEDKSIYGYKIDKTDSIVKTQPKVLIFFKVKAKKLYRPVKIYKGKEIIEIGKLSEYYQLPWEYKEILVLTKKNDSLFNQTKKLYTYYDFENDIKIEIYEHPNEKNNKNGDTNEKSKSKVS